MSNVVIKAEDLSFFYEEDDGAKLPVLRNFNLEIEKGSFVALLGHNGSGKSTLAKLFNLILTPASGSLYLFGKKVDYDEMTEDDLFDIGKRVGMVFQNPDNQLVATIVEEDVAFGPENLGVPSKEIRERVNKALDFVKMRKFARHSPHQLSGGQKQRIAIAGIIACNPEIVIFDESTAMLDPLGRAEVMNTIETLNKKYGTTVIIITHYMEEAAKAGRVVVIDKRFWTAPPGKYSHKQKYCARQDWTVRRQHCCSRNWLIWDMIFPATHLHRKRGQQLSLRFYRRRNKQNDGSRT